MSSPLPCGSPSTTSTMTTSASSRSAIRWARVAPTLPAPTIVTFLRMLSPRERRETRDSTATGSRSRARARRSATARMVAGKGASRAMAYQHVTVPAEGARIGVRDGKLQVPDRPIVPFIEGDGTGPDIWRASVRVFDAAVAKAYGGRRKIAWMEVLAGEKSFKKLDTWLPDETVEAFREFLVGIKGPLTTPIGGGIRSLNVALRQMLDLYVCLRPVRWFRGVPSPVKHPEKVDMVIFRENTEDIYAGIEFESGTEDAQGGARLPEADLPQGLPEGALPGVDRDRHQAGLAGRQRAARPVRDPLRPRQQAQEPHPRPQGQHHEVHRGRLPQLGLRPRRARVRRLPSTPGSSGSGRSRRKARRPPTPSRRRRSRAGSSWSRTRSPTSRSSRS